MDNKILGYLNRGWAVLPTHSVVNGVCTCNNPKCSSPGKHPRTQRGVKDASKDIDVVRSWFDYWKSANVAVATGKVSGIFVVDVDPKSGGLKSLEEFSKKYFGDKDTYTVLTGSGGYHFYFTLPEGVDIPNYNAIYPGIDIRSDGGYVVAPPSVHISGGSYKLSHENADVLEPTSELVELLASKSRKSSSMSFSDALNRENDFKVPSIDKLLEGIPEGERDNTIFKWACKYRRKNGENSRSGALALAYIAASRCVPPFPREEVEKCVNSAWKQDHSDPSYMEKALSFENEFEPLTDVGNSRRFIKNFKNKFTYVPGWGWMVWDNNHWRRDDGGLSHNAAKEVSTIIKLEAQKLSQEDEEYEIKAHINWAKRSQSAGSISATLAVAQTDPDIVSYVDDFDTDDLSLAVSNGIIDLRTGELRKTSFRDKITKNTNVIFDDKVDQSRWLEFLYNALDGDEELMSYIKRAAGYTLTGLNTEEVFFVISGPPASGKSTFLDGLLSALGGYATSAQADTFMYRRNKSVGKEEIARLAGHRLVSVSEIREGDYFSEALIKQFTGGDKVSARFLYQDTFEFVPKFKLWVGTNHDPGAQDDAMWRRIKKIPFPRTVPAHKRDYTLKAWAKNPLEGGSTILAWAVEGAREWLAEGINDPQKVRDEVNKYRMINDRNYAFVAENIIQKENNSIKASDLYFNYCQWCEKYNEFPKKFPAFIQMLDRVDYISITNIDGVYYIIGADVSSQEFSMWGM